MNEQTHHLTIADKASVFAPPPPILLLPQTWMFLLSLNLFSSRFCPASLSEPPRPLAHLCRVKVRSLIGRNRIKLIDTLPLPYRLIRYLQHDYTQ